MVAASGRLANCDRAAGRRDGVPRQIVAPSPGGRDGECRRREACRPHRISPTTGIVTVVSGLGRCEAQPRGIATLTPAVEGRVAEILFTQGDAVKSGQPLVRLDAVLAQAALAEKLAIRDGADASLRLLQVPPRPEEQAALKLAIEQARVAVARAQAAVNRLRPLRQRNEIPEEQMFEAEQALRQAMLQQQTADAPIYGPDAKASFRSGRRSKAESRQRPSRGRGGPGSVGSTRHSLSHRRHAGQPELSPRANRIRRDSDRRSHRCPACSTSLSGCRWKIPAAFMWASPLNCDGARKKDSQGATSSPREAANGKVTFVGGSSDPQTGNLPVRLPCGKSPTADCRSDNWFASQSSSAKCKSSPCRSKRCRISASNRY